MTRRANAKNVPENDLVIWPTMKTAEKESRSTPEPSLWGVGGGRLREEVGASAF